MRNGHQCTIFSTRLGFVAAACFGLVGAESAHATNIAPTGTGTIGYVNDPTQNGVEVDHAGSNTYVNDNDVTTHVDTFPDSSQDYVGVTFGSPVSGVQNVQLIMAMFLDGGWFGPSNTGPGAGNPLPASDLTAPVVQVTTDGTNWMTVPDTNNYVSVMTGAGIGGGNNPNPNNSPVSTFTLNTPADNILGIRLLGNGGGTAANNGFIGVSELYVNTPEPASLGVMSLAGLLTLRRRRA